MSVGVPRAQLMKNAYCDAMWLLLLALGLLSQKLQFWNLNPSMTVWKLGPRSQQLGQEAPGHPLVALVSSVVQSWPAR